MVFASFFDAGFCLFWECFVGFVCFSYFFACFCLFFGGFSMFCDLFAGFDGFCWFLLVFVSFFIGCCMFFIGCCRCFVCFCRLFICFCKFLIGFCQFFTGFFNVFYRFLQVFVMCFADLDPIFKITFHVFWQILIPYSRLDFIRRISRIIRHAPFPCFSKFQIFEMSWLQIFPNSILYFPSVILSSRVYPKSRIIGFGGHGHVH